MSNISNPWREFIENCVSGDNYFRASEYMDLLADLDRGYAAEAEVESLRSRLAEVAALRKDAERYHRVMQVIRSLCAAKTPELLADLDAAMGEKP